MGPFDVTSGFTVTPDVPVSAVNKVPANSGPATGTSTPDATPTHGTAGVVGRGATAAPAAPRGQPTTPPARREIDSQAAVTATEQDLTRRPQGRQAKIAALLEGGAFSYFRGTSPQFFRELLDQLK